MRTKPLTLKEVRSEMKNEVSEAGMTAYHLHLSFHYVGKERQLPQIYISCVYKLPVNACSFNFVYKKNETKT